MQRTGGMVLLLLLLIALGALLPAGQAQIPVPPTTAPRAALPQDYLRSERLGITFISSAQQEHDDTRYRNALLLGAGWNRWPLYWNAVEVAPGSFDWSEYDRLVRSDVRYGLNINAILLDRPDFHAAGELIAGLEQPIFADGSDTPAAGKAINPANPWASFVFQAVQRYRPGGTLAQQMGWVSGEGVTVWEVWNEPDLPQFWTGSIETYARLLKVAYLAAHQADPNATVMFGGLLFNTSANWLGRVLALYQADPLAAQHNYFMDAVALHSYSYPWRTGWLTSFVQQTMDAYSINRPIFVNESGVNVWDDYPGPVWAASPQQRYKRGTSQQQAWYFIQSTAYAWAEGAEVVFFHQLYDDCGDQAAGSNFPPHNGELCSTEQPCYGDAFGLFRNRPDALCYNQHPNPGTPRPAATAFRLMAQVFSQESFTGGTVSRENDIITIRFERPFSNEFIYVIWNTRFEPNGAVIPAQGSSAVLYTMQRTTTLYPDDGGLYRIALGAAVPDNFPQDELEPNDRSAIGGEPVILVERVSGSLVADDATPIVQSDGSSGTPMPITPAPPLAPTIDPALDDQQPVTSMEPLPEVSPRTFLVRWGADDNGQIARYVVWVQINDEAWTPWLETQRTESIYTGEPGNTYRFAVWAVDTGGNWSPNTDLQPQAETRVE